MTPRKPREAPGRDSDADRVPDPPPSLPSPGDAWAQIEAFAKCTNGYAYAERIGEEGPRWFESWWERFKVDGSLPGDHDALRALLALAVRRIYWLSWDNADDLIDETRPFGDVILIRLNSPE